MMACGGVSNGDGLWWCLSLHFKLGSGVIVLNPQYRTVADPVQILRCNVDLLQLIQLGITLFDEHGNRPEKVECCTGLVGLTKHLCRCQLGSSIFGSASPEICMHRTPLIFLLGVSICHLDSTLPVEVVFR